MSTTTTTTPWSVPHSSIRLRPYQHAAIDAVNAALEKGTKRPLLSLATGCHRAGQRVLMYDGSLKAVEDVRIGDLLMGPDSAPRAVLRLERGKGPMVTVRPVKGKPFVVNDQHILSLVRTTTRTPKSGERSYPSQQGGVVRDVCVRDYLGWSTTAKHIHKLFRCGVQFPERPSPDVDPYLMGALLGDGGLSVPGRIGFTSADDEVLAAVGDAVNQIERHGRPLRLRFVGSPERPYDYQIAREGKGGGGKSAGSGNPLRAALSTLGLHPIRCEDRFIPDDYKLGSRETRLQVLAGLIDTDGSRTCNGFDASFKSRRLTEDMAFVARSLGLAAYVKPRDIGTSDGPTRYWRVSISGDCSSVPVRLPRKQCEPRRQKKDVLRTGFTVEPTGTVEDYYGFTLDGDHRYLLADFTVTHNCGKTVIFSDLVRRRGGTALILAHRDELLQQAAKKLVQVAPELGMSIGFVQADKDNTHSPIVIGSIATLARKNRLDRLPRMFDTVVVDEAHHASSASYMRVLEHVGGSPLILGVTATPERNDDKHLANVWQDVVYEYGLLQAIRDGYLVEPRGIRVKLDMDLATVKETGGDFQDGALADTMMNADAPRHVVRAWQEHAADRKTIVFAPTVQMAHVIAATYRMAGITAEAVDGTTPTEHRGAIFSRFERGETQVLVNVGVATEGYDEPSVACVVIARPTKSRVLFSQIVGRGVRTYPGKDDCLVLDVSGATDSLSLMSVPKLLGLRKPPKDGETVVQAHHREQMEDAQGDFTGPDGRLIVEQVNLLSDADQGGRKRLHWLKVGDVHLLNLGGSTLELEREADGTWAVVEQAGAERKVLAQGVDLGYAHGIAEDLARERKALVLTDPNAKWRRQPAKSEQISYARRLGITVRDGMTRGEVSDLIDAAKVQKRRGR